MQKKLLLGFWLLAALWLPLFAVFLVGGWSDTFRSGDASGYVVGAVLVCLAEAIFERRDDEGPDRKDWWWIKLQNPVRLGFGGGAIAYMTVITSVVILSVNLYYAISDHHSDSAIVDWVQVLAVFLSMLPLLGVRFATTKNRPDSDPDEPMRDWGGDKVLYLVIYHRRAQRFSGMAMERLEKGKFRSGIYRLDRAASYFKRIDQSCAYTALWHAAAARLARGTRYDVIVAERYISAARKIAASLGVDTQSEEVSNQENTVLFERILDYRRQAFGDADPRTVAAAEDLADAYRKAGLRTEAIAQYERALILRIGGTGRP